ncbi:MAG: 50S ribosomal protein L3 [Candidatus Magasanikbacteria bacterium]|nr:50S ribosomal protein L3 [Candidatus Magasanikbacteria bacterium]
MKFILGKKLEMTQVFRDNGEVVPVTRVKAGPCVVTQIKTKEKDRSSAVQVGFGKQKLFRLNKAQQGHLRDLEPVRVLKDIAVKTDDHGLSRGDTYGVEIFTQGEKVQVTGRSKGKGFQGVVKRHNFAGSLKTHGHKDQHRMPGSIGATGPARVFKGTKMGGHMGDDQVTVKNLEIVGINTETGELTIKGALPGARGGLLIISTQEGEMKIEKSQEKEDAKQEVVAEEAKEDTSVEVSTEKTEEAKQVEVVTEEDVKKDTKEEVKKEDVAKSEKEAQE